MAHRQLAHVAWLRETEKPETVKEYLSRLAISSDDAFMTKEEKEALRAAKRTTKKDKLEKEEKSKESERSQTTQRPGNYPANRIKRCFNCGVEGHLSYDCTRTRRR